MAFWRFQVVPCQPGSCPQLMDSDGKIHPAIMLDDSTGNFYVGGKNVSQTWIPSGSSGLQPVTPSPTADQRVFALPQQPKLLMLWVGGLYQTPGASADFTLSGTTITFNYTPEPGAAIQAVVGY